MDCTCFTSILSHLWLPVLAASAAVWIASAIVWMFLPHHRGDWKKLPNEPAFMDAVRAMGVPPGVYGFPWFASHRECSTPEGQELWKKGPVGLLNVWKPDVSMGRNMAITFLVYIVVSAMIAALGVFTVAPGTAFAPAFRVFALAGVLAYAFAFIPNGIWFQQGRSTIMCVLDGIAYGLITGAVMAALWPSAAA